MLVRIAKSEFYAQHMSLWVDDLAVSTLDTRIMKQFLILGDGSMWLWCFIPGASGTIPSILQELSSHRICVSEFTAICDEHNLVCSLNSWPNLIKSPCFSAQAVLQLTNDTALKIAWKGPSRRSMQVHRQRGQRLGRHPSWPQMWVSLSVGPENSSWFCQFTATLGKCL